MALTKEALANLVAEIDSGEAAAPDDVLVTVFNPLPFSCRLSPSVYVDFRREKEIRAFHVLKPVYGPEGNRVDPSARGGDSGGLP